VKAFDRVPREFLWQVLQKFGAPEKLISLLRSLYSDFQVKFVVDEVSHTLKCTIGVKQGDILGPVLFTIFIAAIMIMWRKKTNRPCCLFHTKQDYQMTGRRYNTKGIEFPIENSEYADDTAVLFESRRILTEFAIHTGDLDHPDKPLKTEVLFISAPEKKYHNPVTFDDTDLSEISIGRNQHWQK